MANKKIPIPAIERNKAWIEAITNTLKELGDENLSRCMMKAAGKNCAMQMHEIIHGHLEDKPKSVEDMIEAINTRRREILKANTFWELKDDKAYFTLKTCGCDLVQSGLAEPNSTFCLCSAGTFENLFAPFYNGKVRTEIVKAIGRGDKQCEFIVHFEK